MLQIYPTTLIWLEYISTQYIHPNISGHNIQGQTFPMQCNNICPSKGKKKMAKEPITLDISLFVSRLIACSRWVTEVALVSSAVVLTADDNIGHCFQGPVCTSKCITNEK